ncbi:N-acetylmuramoyl-L-alanine amidase [Cytobacillus oceanisediminis]|uniref:N-acetylmuramoyl-L-alanine amidase n=1 Tax=Cytobacillus oceanisediminis TaxID=665099 RepID=UPI001C240FA7|nr:N-acetylmuramoyl-L-alanine amidase [Cytobacillus oceanisediminis]MBU8773174.1 N-acetylmuramoyl-L-alanine amidase [Cytobacillus oceanisediminis]
MSEELHNDIGHGKNTYPPNKGVPGLPEFSFNTAVAAETKRLLAGKISTYEAQPFNGNDVPLITRTNRYNARYKKNKKAIGMSHHANANNKSSVRGFGVFFWHSSPEAKKLAQIILDEYKKEFPNRKEYPIWGDGLFPSVPGTWTELHMCRETAGVFVLIEWEFMTNPESLKLLKSNDYRKRCGLVAAKAACRWYGIHWPEETKPVVQKPAVKPKEEESVEDGVYWDGKKMARGQVGRVIILKSLPLWSPEKKKHRALSVGDVITVYRINETDNYKYEVGGGYTVSNVKGYVKYEQAPDDLIEANKAFYKDTK